MLDEKRHLIVLAGLLHDVGKLFERGEIFASARKDPLYLQSCPVNQQGQSTHLHITHTHAFCDWLSERFDCLKEAGGEWKNWCAAHHRNDETGPEASMVRLSDRLSSREREMGGYYQRRIHQKTRLEPVLERVFIGDNRNAWATRFRYPLRPLRMERGSCFPMTAAELGVKEMKRAAGAVSNPDQWTHLVSDEPLVNEFRDLGEGLLSEIEALADSHPGMRLDHLLISLMTLLERYTANVPSATNVRHPDISLFDHLRSTAAICQALYLFQENEGRFPVDMSPDDSAVRWLLVCGDFSGIQKFIYNLTNKGAAKGLRGRSFYVGYFCRICADYLLRELGLTRASLLYNSGGKFYLLLPAHLKSSLFELRSWINGWLLDRFGGDVFFGLGLADVSARMFHQGEMDEAWKTAAEFLEKDRMTQFSDLMNQDFFEPQTEFDPTQSCPVCGSRQVNGSEDRCRSCHELERVGSWLKDTDVLLTVRGYQSIDRMRDKQGVRRYLDFPNLDTRLFFLDIETLEKVGGLKEMEAECVFLNRWADRPFSELPLPGCAVSTLYVGKWVPDRQFKTTENGDRSPWDFDDYAEHAKGIGRLGILRMDVDNLGTIFVRGLLFPERKPVSVNGKQREGWGEVFIRNDDPLRKSMASISRMVTLSRQLNHFFSGYVPGLLEEDRFDRCQVIYAGGDDLFIIGSWDQLPDLAKTIRSEFQAFCCGNPDFTISGGLTLQRGRYPIYKGAKKAGDAEQQAKEARLAWGKAWSPLDKDGFCFLGVPVVWEDMAKAEIIKALLEDEMENNRGLMSFLAQMTAGNKVLANSVSRRKNLRPTRAWKEIAYTAWRWRTAYQLRRRYKDRETRRKWADILFADQFGDDHAIVPVYAWLELPLRWTDYLHRNKGGQ